MFKRFVSIFLLLSAVNVNAQSDFQQTSLYQEMTESRGFRQSLIDHNIFSHLDLGLSVGSGGVGINLSTSITDYVKLRAGIDYMPRFTVPMSFSITSYSNGAVNSSNFARVQELMYDLSGIEIDETVRMKGNARMYDFKFLVDVYPWTEHKNWHLTAGFYYGTGKVGHAENYADEMPALLAMKMYNRFYELILNTDFSETAVTDLVKDVPGLRDFISGVGDVYLDPDKAVELKDKIASYGRLGVHVGDFKDGSAFMMEPGKDGMVKADLFVHRFKPYLGVGFNSAISRDKRLKIGFDAGVLFWGSPKLITHSQPMVENKMVLSDFESIFSDHDIYGTVTSQITNEFGETYDVYGSYDLINDMSNVRGKVGTYVDIASKLTVYPVLNFRISYTLF